MKTALGMPLEGTRPITPAESAYLREQHDLADRYVFFAQILAWGFVFMLLIGLPFLFFTRVLLHAPNVVIVFLVLAMLTGMTVSFLYVRKFKRLRKTLRETWSETSVSIFSGTISPMYCVPENLPFFKSTGIFGDPNEPVTMECLEVSGVILLTNGKRPSKIETVNIAVTGEALRNTSAGAFPGQLSEMKLQSDRETRSLSDAELRELESHAKGLVWYKPYWHQGLLILIVFLLIRNVNYLQDPINVVFSILFVLVLISNIFRIFRMIRFSKLNQMDVAARAVVVVYENGQKFEILPHSRRLWTVDDAPTNSRQLWAGEFNSPGRKG
ncbi:MAG: hypothetical protein KF784_14025 [Fimbriimonadaceae bacterium]|nr:hypothetical protein [Fimbriimonadaceae bacterium]